MLLLPPLPLAPLLCQRCGSVAPTELMLGVSLRCGVLLLGDSMLNGRMFGIAIGMGCVDVDLVCLDEGVL